MAIPETYLNTVGRMRGWLVTGPDGNTYDLWEGYMNNTLVYKKALELLLPDPNGNNATINLRSFIDANNPENYESILVINNFVQPTITTGDLSGLEVEFENNGSVLGNANGADALVLTSDVLLNNQGWIKGAGGAGGTGGSGTSSSRLSGYWDGRASYDDPRYKIDGVEYSGYRAGYPGINCVPGGSTAFFNRFWKTGGGSKSGAWVSTGCTGQSYWNTTSNADAPYWGDQGRLRSGYIRHGSGTGLQVLFTARQYHNGGSGGAGGYGQQFLHQAGPGSGSAGSAGSITGPNPGFDRNTGYNFTDNAAILASLAGGIGGAGANWGDKGSTGSASAGGNPGAAGQFGGYAIRGQGHLLPGSVTGNVIGTIG